METGDSETKRRSRRLRHALRACAWAGRRKEKCRKWRGGDWRCVDWRFGDWRFGDAAVTGLRRALRADRKAEIWKVETWRLEKWRGSSGRGGRGCAAEACIDGVHVKVSARKAEMANAAETGRSGEVEI